MKKTGLPILLGFLLLARALPLNAYCPMIIDANLLEPTIKHARNILIARVERKFPRTEKFHQTTFGILYPTMGLELKVKKILLGNLPADKPLTLAYIQSFESKPGFVPGKDYMFILSQDKPDFLRVADWGTFDSAFLIKGGYSLWIWNWDLVSAFGYDAFSKNKEYDVRLERLIPREELARLVQARADRIFGEAESEKILAETAGVEAAVKPGDVAGYTSDPVNFAAGLWFKTGPGAKTPNYGRLLGKAFTLDGKLRKFEVRTKDPRGRWAESIDYYFYESGRTACARSTVKNYDYREGGKWEKANHGSFDIRTGFFYSRDGKLLLRIKEGLFEMGGKPFWDEDPRLEPGYRSPPGVTWEWPGPQTVFEPSKMVPIAGTQDLRLR